MMRGFLSCLLIGGAMGAGAGLLLDALRAAGLPGWAALLGVALAAYGAASALVSLGGRE